MRSKLYPYPSKYQYPERLNSHSRDKELAKVSTYTPGQWKTFLPQEIRQPSDRPLTRTPSYQSYRDPQPDYVLNDEQSNNDQLDSILSSRREQNRRRESAMRKVRELQQKVLPLVRTTEQEEDSMWIGWQSRIQQRLLRLQGRLQNMKKQMQLQLERRVVEMETRWQSRIAQYLEQTQGQYDQ